MHIKRRKNASGSTSVQVIEKKGGKTRLVKSVGSSPDEVRIEELEAEAREFIRASRRQLELAINSSQFDTALRDYFITGDKLVVKAQGPELLLGKIFDEIGFNEIQEPLFRHLVLGRLTYPVSKLKTVEYLSLHQQAEISVSSIYRFLDRFYKEHKAKVEEISFKQTKKVLGGEIVVVFYDMTTLYFEAEDEDDLRKVGFSKDGKFQHPQIMLGLLVGENGYPIAYDIYEGNTFEGSTIIPALQKAQKRFGIKKPMVIADSGLLSKDNLNNLAEQDYVFILGARIKNDSNALKQEILTKAAGIKNGESFVVERPDKLRLVVGYSDKRAKKDAANRAKGVARLESRIKTGQLTKSSLVNRGYNKFLKIESNVKVTVDTSKIAEDQKWDGLKGYITNSELQPAQVISNYNHLWKIERAFRISKTDLRIRPIFHRKKDRIEAHVCIAFVAYAVYKELERLLMANKINLSARKAIDLSKAIFRIEALLPDSKRKVTIFNKLTPEQQTLLQIIGA